MTYCLSMMIILTICKIYLEESTTVGKYSPDSSSSLRESEFDIPQEWLRLLSELRNCETEIQHNNSR